MSSCLPTVISQPLWKTRTCNSHMFYVSSRNLGGRWTYFEDHILQMGWGTKHQQGNNWRMIGTKFNCMTLKLLQEPIFPTPLGPWNGVQLMSCQICPIRSMRSTSWQPILTNAVITQMMRLPPVTFGPRIFLCNVFFIGVVLFLLTWWSFAKVLGGVMMWYSMPWKSTSTIVFNGFLFPIKISVIVGIFQGDDSFDGWLDFWLRVCQALNQRRIF